MTSATVWRTCPQCWHDFDMSHRLWDRRNRCLMVASQARATVKTNFCPALAVSHCDYPTV